MTELHLDTDEWGAILHSLKCEVERVSGQLGQDLYAEWLEGIISKVEIALANKEE